MANNNYRNTLREVLEEDSIPIRRVNNKTGEIAEYKNGEHVVIGYTLSYLQDLESDLNTALDKAEEYFNELVNAGLRERPKTQEDIINEVKTALTKQESMNMKMLELLENQQRQIDKLGGANNNEHDGQSVTETKSNKPRNDRKSGTTTQELPVE